MYLIVTLWLLTTVAMLGQHTTPITGMDAMADVIDHTRFDSLWRASKRFGKLDTRGVQSDAYRDYRDSLATASPSGFLPESQTAFWINAYLALLMEAMNNRVGYRSTVWDSLYLTHDTAYIAHAPFTLQQLADTVANISGSIAVMSLLSTGSSSGPPYPSHAMFARTIRSELRNQLRRVVRSEKYVLYDPAGNVLQLSVMFKPWEAAMIREQGSVVEFLLPWMSESVAAQVALGAARLTVQFSDRIETWKRVR